MTTALANTNPMHYNTIASLIEKPLNDPSFVKKAQKFALEALRCSTSPENAAKYIISVAQKQCIAIGAVTTVNLNSVYIDKTLGITDWRVIHDIEVKMLMSIAIVMGHDVTDEKVKAILWEQLVLGGISQLFRVGAIMMGRRTADHLIDITPSDFLKSIDKPFGHRVVTKYGHTGDFNLMSFAFLGGATVGAAYNWGEVSAFGYATLRAFQKDALPPATVDQLNKLLNPQEPPKIEEQSTSTK